jgi:hypothetical protein
MSETVLDGCQGRRTRAPPYSILLHQREHVMSYLSPTAVNPGAEGILYALQDFETKEE